jgi:multidrug efflux system outer membrane protein
LKPFAFAALFAAVWPAWGQSTPPGVEDTVQDWKKSNADVGQFRRGHVDLLKLERDPPPAAPAACPVLDVESAVRIALANNPGLQAAMAQLAISDAERAQASQLPSPHLALGRLREGQVREIERMLSFNVLNLLTLPWRAKYAGQKLELAKLQAAQEVIRTAADTRKSWIQAVAAQQTANYLRDAKEAAEAGAELARRMARVGNWSKLQQAREQATLVEISAQLARAEQAARAEREKLTRLMGGYGEQAPYALPDRLPDIPKQLADRGDIEATALRERVDVRAARDEARYVADSMGLERVTGVIDALTLGVVRNTTWDGAGGRETQRGVELELPLPIFDWGRARAARSEAVYMQSVARVRDVAVKARSEAREAWSGWRTAHEVATRYRDEVVPLRRFINDETVLRYNGMLASVWELLAETRNHVTAVNAAIAAQRDFWIADTDLNLALTGTSPGAIATLGGATSSPAAAQGH